MSEIDRRDLIASMGAALLASRTSDKPDRARELRPHAILRTARGHVHELPVEELAPVLEALIELALGRR